MLKLEIWETGFHVNYQMQGEFRNMAEKNIDALDEASINELKTAYQDRHHNAKDITKQSLVLKYAGEVIEEIVKRATRAAYRTTNW